MVRVGQLCPRTRFTNVAVGARRKCEELGIPLLGDVPLHTQICTDADAGKPTVVGDPESPQAQAFIKIIDRLKSEIKLG